MKNWEILFGNLGNALERLGEALEQPVDDKGMNRDATIQRFEFTIELFWKVLRKLLLREKIKVSTLKETLRQAYASQWIDEEALWLSMMDDRNNTSHVYHEEKAIEIYQHIQTYHPIMVRTYEFLKQKFTQKN
ncbi:MAG: HI0074 family nucleotidyltransferase substrate-binding subunit [Pseudomonadota bacterium]